VSQQTLDERNALYRLVSRAIGRLDACESVEDVREVRQWLDGEQDKIIDPRRALVEEITGPALAAPGETK
jgi:hypothetical protein